MGWFRMKLGDSWLSTSPRAQPTHWSWAFLPLDPPVAVADGERVRFQLARVAYGEWSWKMRAAAGVQQRSTLFASPMKAATIRKAALDHRPELTPEGAATAYVLSLCDGSRSAVDLAAMLQARDGGPYQTRDEALRFVQAVLKRHS